MNRETLKQVNRYMFNKKESIVVEPSREKLGFASQYEQVKIMSVMLCNLHELGYTIPRDEIDKLMTMSAGDLNELVYKPLLEEAKEAKGAHVEHRVLFPGFPESVKNVDIDTLSDIRFASYFTTIVDRFVGQDALGDGSITRDYVSAMMKRAMDSAKYQHPARDLAFSTHIQDKTFYKNAPEMLDKVMSETGTGFKEKTPRAIHIVGEEAFTGMVKNMLQARASLSPYDKEIVLFAVDHFDKSQYMPDKVQFRENQAMLDKYNFEHRNLHNINIRSLQDFERLLIGLSDGDLSLSKKQMVRNFTNAERKTLYKLFERAVKENGPVMIESSSNRQSLRFCENVLRNRLHFDDNKIGNRILFRDFMQRAEKHEQVMAIYERNMREHKYDIAAKVLAKYSPTLFIQHTREIFGKACLHVEKTTGPDRLLHERLSRHGMQEKQKSNSMLRSIEDTFKATAKLVDVKTLLSLYNEVLKDQPTYKIMQPKGTKNDLIVKENKSVPLNSKAQGAIMTHLTLAIDYQMKRAEQTGKIQIQTGTKVYIDPALKECPIPTVGRTDTGKNRTLQTGTKVPMDNPTYLRAALYKQADRNQFIDFSAAFLDETYHGVGQLGWNNLTTGGAYHSGDTMHCSGKGATEVIDIDIAKMRETYPTARYVVYSAIMWEGNPLNSCNQLFMTLSPAQELGSENGQSLNELKQGKNDLFDPSQVEFKFDIVGNRTVAVPMLYDLVENKAIIMNLELSKKCRSMNDILQAPRHFDLPAHCEALENYGTDLSMKCFAANQHTFASIGTLATCYASAKGAEFVEDPSLADVRFTIGRPEIEDGREVVEGIENPEVVTIDLFDKDEILTMIPDPKAIEAQEKAIAQEQEKNRLANGHGNFDDQDGYDDFGRDFY